MTGLWLLVALPAFAMRLVPLIRWEPRHAVPRQDPMHRGDCNGDAVEPVQIRRDPPCSEVIVLAQVEDLADDLARGRSRRPLRCPRPIAQAGVSVLGVASLPFVKRLPGNPEAPAHAGDVSCVGRLS